MSRDQAANRRSFIMGTEKEEEKVQESKQRRTFPSRSGSGGFRTKCLREALLRKPPMGETKIINYSPLINLIFYNFGN